MKYLSLDQEELKELRNLRLGSVSFSMAITLLGGIGVALIAYNLFSQVTIPVSLSLTVMIFGAFMVYHNNKAYISDLQKKQKKVYKGVLSRRRVTNRHGLERFEFNVDGNIFYVDKESYEKYQEGDLLEFHIAPSLKHLFKIEKIK